VSVKLVAAELPTFALTVLSPMTRPEISPSNVLDDELLNADETSVPFKVTVSVSPGLISAGSAASRSALPPLTMCGSEDLIDSVGDEVGVVGVVVTALVLSLLLPPQPVKVVAKSSEEIPNSRNDFLNPSLLLKTIVFIHSLLLQFQYPN
jgi:hypothetical protein